jgi:hypothetical protein
VIASCSGSDSGSSFGSGIGSGGTHHEGETSSVSEITILNSHVTAVNFPNGSAIGTGYVRDARSQIRLFEILNCTIGATVASVFGGSGIGTGSVAGEGASVIDHLMISSSKIIANSGLDSCVIGSGRPGSYVNSLTFSGVCFIECSHMGAVSAVSASQILIVRGTLMFLTDSSTLFGTSPLNSGPFELVVLYRQATSENCEPLSMLDNHFVHIGALNLSDSQLNSLTFCIQKTHFERCFGDYPQPIRSFVVSVPEEGDYSFPASADGVSGQLESSVGRTVFSLRPHYSFIDILLFKPLTVPDRKSGVSVPLIIGLGVGLFVFAIVVALMVFACRRRSHLERSMDRELKSVTVNGVPLSYTGLYK